MNVYVDSLARTLAARDVQVDVFTARGDDGFDQVTEVVPGYRVVHVDSPGRDRAERIGSFAEGVAKWAAGEGADYDVLHSHYWLSAWAGVLLETVLDAALAISFHTLGRVRDVGSGEPPQPLTRIAAETEVIARAGCVVASTPVEAADLIENYGARPERVCVTPPGVDHSLFGPGEADVARAVLGLPPGPTAAVVGRIQPLKGIDLAIRAIASLPPVRLLVVGGPSGPAGEFELVALRSLAADLAPGRIEFMEPLPHAEVADVYRAVDVLVVPSLAESFGLVAVEAQACGIPVVAARVEGLGFSVAEGRSGLLVDGNDPSAWAAALGSVLFDEVEAARLAAGALAHAEHFSWEITGSRLLELYRGLA